MEQNKERLEIFKKIAELEKQGKFDIDVEDDPPTIPLKPGQVDYLEQKFSTKIFTEFANIIAKRHFDNCIKRGELVIKEVKGYENYLAVADGGVIITANHFHPFDNYAVFKVIESQLGRKRLYKIIREGNYTNFKGLYGFFFRHCNTLPLCSGVSLWREFSSAVNTLLLRGEKILIYPEQAMWWNYRKPRPLKAGAFRFAAKANVPVLPFFLTMEDGKKIDSEGFPVQEYTVHILPAIYPDKNLNIRENAGMMCEKNYNLWKKTYEEFYKIPLTYTTEGKEVLPCSI